MTFRASQLESMVTWCSRTEELRDARNSARRTFFGDDDPRPVRYLPGAGDFGPKERRFLGWFMFGFELPGGGRPSELAVESLYTGATAEEALRAVKGARYLMAVVTSVIPGRSVFMELEDERFEVRSRDLSRVFSRDQCLVSYIVPSRPGLWIPGPGWTEWPVRLGPNIRKELKSLQPDPIQFERLLQMRSDKPEAERVEPPKDSTLEAAVERMTEAAKAEGRPALVMPAEQWRQMVWEDLEKNDATAFGQKLIELVGDVQDIEELNRWLALAMNIWNATPQPDRGGKTAYELSEEEIIPFEEMQEQ